MAQRWRHWKVLHERRKHLHFHVVSRPDNDERAVSLTVLRRAVSPSCGLSTMALWLYCLPASCTQGQLSPLAALVNIASVATLLRCDTRFLNRERLPATSSSRRCNQGTFSSIAQCGAARPAATTTGNQLWHHRPLWICFTRLTAGSHRCALSFSFPWTVPLHRHVSSSSP